MSYLQNSFEGFFFKSTKEMDEKVVLLTTKQKELLSIFSVRIFLIWNQFCAFSLYAISSQESHLRNAHFLFALFMVLLF